MDVEFDFSHVRLISPPSPDEDVLLVSRATLCLSSHRRNDLVVPGELTGLPGR